MIRVIKSFTNLLFIIAFFILVGCQPKGSVEIKTNGIYRPITFGIIDPYDDQKTLDLSGQFLDFDEWDRLKNPAIPIVLTVTNNSLFPYTEVNISSSSLIEEDGTSMAFLALSSGIEVGFPGFGGTCSTTRIINPGETCKVVFSINADTSKIYHEQFTLTFKNYVEAESHQGSVKFIAGLPANLVVLENNGKTRIEFAQLDDPLVTKPIVERTDGKEFNTKRTIVNTGELRARNIDFVELGEDCFDIDNQMCESITFENAYSFSTNCQKGQELKAEESCNLDITYLPKNTAEPLVGDDARFEQIHYTGHYNFYYEKNPDKDLKNLSITTDSYSTKIAGRLSTTMSKNLNNGGEFLIQGERSTSTIKASNVGYRALRLKKLHIKITENTPDITPTLHWASCERAVGTNRLSCTSDDPTFPFRLYDNNNCLLKNSENLLNANGESFTVERTPLIPINSNCEFGITFAPSSEEFINFVANNFFNSSYALNGKTIRAYYEYDNQWKDGEDHCTIDGTSGCSFPESGYLVNASSTSFNHRYSTRIEAQRRRAARLEVTEVKFFNDPQNPKPNASNYNTSDLNLYQTYDLGTFARMAKSYKDVDDYFKYLEIKIENKGDAPATDVQISYPYISSGNLTDFSIPLNTSVVSVLNDNLNCESSGECYWRKAQTDKFCTTIGNGTNSNTCTLRIKFSPFNVTVPSPIPCTYSSSSAIVDENDCAMFDPNSFIDSDTSPFKSFKITYKNGSQYKDTDEDESPTFSDITSIVKFEAKLIAAGRVTETLDVPRNRLQGNSNTVSLVSNAVQSSTVEFDYILTNIGSGSAANIAFPDNLNGRLKLKVFNWQDDCASNTETLDCRCYNSCNNDTNNGLKKFESENSCKLPYTWTFANITDPERPESSRPSLDNTSIKAEFKKDLQRVPYKRYGLSSGDLETTIGNLSYYNCFEPGVDRTYGDQKALKDFILRFSNYKRPALVGINLSVDPLFPWHTSYLEKLGTSNNALNDYRRYFYRDIDVIPLSVLPSYDSSNNTFTSPLFQFFYNFGVIDRFSVYNKTIPTFFNMLNSRDSVISDTVNNIGIINQEDAVHYHLYLGHFPKYSINNNKILVPFTIYNAGDMNTQININELANPNSNPEIILVDASESPLPLNQDLLVPKGGSTTSYEKLVFAKIDTTNLNTLCSSENCLLEKEFEISYSTAKSDLVWDGTSFDSECTDTLKEDGSRDDLKDNCNRKIKLLLTATIDNTSEVSSSPFSIQYFEANVDKDMATGAFLESNCSTNASSSITVNLNYNQDSSSIVSTDIKGVKPDNSNRGDYTKGIFKIVNSSSLKQKLLDFQLKDDVKDLATSNQTIDGVTLHYINMNNGSDTSCTTDIANDLCSTVSELDQNEYCYIPVKYSPELRNPQPQNFLLSIPYSTTRSGVESNFKNILNIPLTFTPRIKADIRPQVASTTSPTYYYPNNDISGPQTRAPNNHFKIPVTGDTTFNTASKTLSADTLIVNKNDESASFNKQWKEYNIALCGSDTNCLKLYEPSACEGDPTCLANVKTTPDFTGVSAEPSGRKYIEISKGNNYKDFLTIKASEGCFSGFTKFSSNCYLLATIKISHETLYRNNTKFIALNNYPYMAEIKYYDFGSKTTSSKSMYIVYTFDSYPTVTNNNVTMENIYSDQVSTTFDINDNISQGIDNRGDFVGYRVIRAQNNNTFNNTFDLKPSNTNFIINDYMFSDGDPYSFVNTMADSSKYSYYKILAIRRDTTGQWVGGTQYFELANPNDFMTELSGNLFYKILTPPAGFDYFYNDNLLLQSSHPGNLIDFDSALQLCQTSQVYLYDKGVSTLHSLNLVREIHHLKLNDQNTPTWIDDGTNNGYLFADILDENGYVQYPGVCSGMQEFDVSYNNCIRASTTDMYGRMVKGLLSSSFFDSSYYYSYYINSRTAYLSPTLRKAKALCYLQL